MRLRRDLRKDLRDPALGVDQEGGTGDAHVGLAVHLLLTPDAVEVGDLVVLVGQGGEVEPVLVWGLALGRDRVGRAADEPRGSALVVVAVVSNPAGLGGGSGGVRL